MKILIYPTYFPSITQFATIVQADTITFEVEDTFQKQTNRNRLYIYSPNGIQLLNVPIKHSRSKHQRTKDVLIENDFAWQKQHFKSLEAAYRSSPYFEFFEDGLIPIFQKKQKFLMDLNFESMEFVSKSLRFDLKYSKTVEYFKDDDDFSDYRPLANGKKDNNIIEPYKQVFDDREGFLNNLSVLDLLFNEGRYAPEYLRKQQINCP